MADGIRMSAGEKELSNIHGLGQIQIPDEMRSFINHWDSDPIHFLAKNFYEISAANRKCVDFLDSLESAVFGPNLKNVLIQKKKEEEEKKYQTQ